jgi:hypothetical protein
MKTFREANGQAIEWSGKWEYELRSGEDVIGKIHVKAKSGTHAVAESEDGRWIFEKRWLPSEKVTLRLEDSETEVAVFRTKLTEEKGSLEFSDGHVFFWVPANFWRTKCVFTNEVGEPLVHFKRNANPLTAFVLSRGESAGRVVIEQAGFSMLELPLLTLLGCYLMILESM